MLYMITYSIKKSKAHTTRGKNCTFPVPKRLKSDLTHLQYWQHMIVFWSTSQLHKQEIYSHTFLQTKGIFFNVTNVSLNKQLSDFQIQDFIQGKSGFNNDNFGKNFG